MVTLSFSDVTPASAKEAVPIAPAAKPVPSLKLSSFSPKIFHFAAVGCSLIVTAPSGRASHFCLPQRLRLVIPLNRLYHRLFRRPLSVVRAFPPRDCPLLDFPRYSGFNYIFLL